MFATEATPQRVRWEVLWVAKGKVLRKPFEHDLGAAVELYTKLIIGDRKNVTLRSCNMGFPPPDKYADWEMDRYEIVQRGRKRYKKPLPDQLIEPRTYHQRMHAVNVKGWWWCPYCMKLRRFERREGYPSKRIPGFHEGRPVEWITRAWSDPHMACPMCGASHQDWNVQHYNPIAQRYAEMRRTRSDKGVRRT
jgi:hypothetical protein